MNYKRQIRNVAFLMFGTAALVFTSCSKSSDDATATKSPNAQQLTSRPITNKEVKMEMNRLRENLPTVAIYNSTMDKYILLDVNKLDGRKSFSFASPGFAASFSSPTNSAFATSPDGTNYVVVNQGGGFGTGGGGTVTAGNTTLALNYVACFSMGEETLGGDLFDFGGPDADGFSGAIGISGNFEALAEGNFDEDSSPLDYFYGMAFYYILDDNPSGDYDVVDFFTDAGNPSLNDYAFAIVASFQNGGGIYFSSDGTLTFDNASIDFNGHYFALEDFIIGFGDDEGVEDEPNYAVVDGSGQINCN